MRVTHPKHEGIDDEERFEAGYDWFGLHSPWCHERSGFVLLWFSVASAPQSL